MYLLIYKAIHFLYLESCDSTIKFGDARLLTGDGPRSREKPRNKDTTSLYKVAEVHIMAAGSTVDEKWVINKLDGSN